MLILLGQSYVNTDHIVTVMNAPHTVDTATVIQFVAGPTITIHGADMHKTMAHIWKEMQENG